MAGFRQQVPLFTVAVAVGFAAAFGLAQPGPDAQDALHGHAMVGAEPDFHSHEILGSDRENRIQLRLDTRGDIDLREPVIRVRAVNRFERPARALYAIELTDELARSAQDPITESLGTIPAGGEHSFSVELPRWLTEGFYLYRITLAARAGREVADDILEFGIAAHDGQAHLLTDEEWFAHSLANLGAER